MGMAQGISGIVGMGGSMEDMPKARRRQVPMQSVSIHLNKKPDA